MKKTYAGPLGLFISGIKQDIPKELVEKLGKFCSPCSVPWDEKIDHKAIAAAQKKLQQNLPKKPGPDSGRQKKFRTPMDKQYRPRPKTLYKTK